MSKPPKAAAMPPDNASVRWESGAVLVMDQRQLPHEYRTLRLETVDELIAAVRADAQRIAAARHGIPFVVVARESSWGRQLPDCRGIVVAH
ncbi:hypothetical protein ABT168_17630 [Streptomyces sp. NPDC001793]|uniref:hypothetical protein n=1 Tax=Streptomyces sp. NPDC001793 TaxID=3154657 RepID=UPI0033282E99